MKKAAFSAILAALVTNGYTMTCNAAKDNMMKATAQVRANHQSQDSFNLDGQEKLIATDNQIINEYNYIDSLTFYSNNCKNTLN